MQDLKKTTELKFTNNLEVSYLGLLQFEEAVKVQKALLGAALSYKKNFLLGLEHPAVLTLGYRAIVTQEILKANSLPIARTERGGLATIHSEGQLIIYPIINLRELNLGVRDYVCLLLKTTQELLKQLGIDSYTDEKAVGLFTKNGKIAFCGVQIKSGISQHGISLNVRNDISLFSAIRSCGLLDAGFDRLTDYGVELSLSEIFELWSRLFASRLNCSISERL